MVEIGGKVTEEEEEEEEGGAGEMECCWTTMTLRWMQRGR